MLERAWGFESLRPHSMGQLIYSAISSLDGYVADADGKFDRSKPDDEVHAVVNDLTRPVGSHLYGRRMYEVLVARETIDITDQLAFIRTSRRSGEAPRRSSTRGR